MTLEQPSEEQVHEEEMSPSLEQAPEADPYEISEERKTELGANTEDLEKLEAEIEFKQSKTAEEIRSIQAKKEKGDEPGIVYNIQKPTNKFRNLIMAGKIALSGLFALGATKQAGATGNPSDSTGKNIQKEQMMNGVSIKEGLTIRPLTTAERQDWNAFLDFVKEKGYEGSEKLDKKSETLAQSLFAEYKKLHPATTINYEIVPSVQYEMQKLKETVQSFSKRRNLPDSATVMAGVSKVDGWFGSHTSQFRFPVLVVEDFHNNTLVSSKNLGVVNSNFETDQTKKKMKKVPPGVVIEEYSDGKFYTDPHTGDLIKIDN